MSLCEACLSSSGFLLFLPVLGDFPEGCLARGGLLVALLGRELVDRGKGRGGCRGGGALSWGSVWRL